MHALVLTGVVNGVLDTVVSVLVDDSSDVVLRENSIEEVVDRILVVVSAIAEVVPGLVVVTSWQFTFLLSFPFLHLTMS